MIFIIGFILGLVACDDITEVEDISNETVTIVAPVNDAVLDTIAVTFTWQTVQDAENYHIQVATPSFENAVQVVKDSVLTTTSFSTSLDNKNYEWRIRAQNSGYQTAYTKQAFLIEE